MLVTVPEKLDKWARRILATDLLDVLRQELIGALIHYDGSGCINDRTATRHIAVILEIYKLAKSREFHAKCRFITSKQYSRHARYTLSIGPLLRDNQPTARFNLNQNRDTIILRGRQVVRKPWRFENPAFVGIGKLLKIPLSHLELLTHRWDPRQCSLEKSSLQYLNKHLRDSRFMR